MARCLMDYDCADCPAQVGMWKPLFHKPYYDLNDLYDLFRSYREGQGFQSDPRAAGRARQELRKRSLRSLGSFNYMASKADSHYDLSSKVVQVVIKTRRSVMPQSQKRHCSPNRSTGESPRGINRNRQQGHPKHG